MTRPYRLIVETGSSKTNWFFINKEHLVKKFHTEGFNPSYSEVPGSDFINETIVQYLNKTSHIYYYGAGTATIGSKTRISNIFNPYGIQSIEVQSDMIAAARATCFDQQGYVAILGTGSNTSYYDGSVCHSILPSLGYILGDQGSGNYIGKQLLRSYFYNQMPKSIKSQFYQKYGLTKDTLITELYSSALPARYLGTFTKFISEINNDWSREFTKNIFLEFVDLHFVGQKRQHELHLHFVGSVAFVFKESLSQACKERQIQIGEILQSPDTKLIEYHIKNYE